VEADGRVTSIAYCPIGIDSDRIEHDLALPGVPAKVAALQQLYKGKKIIVGRDKLDWTKGVLPKVSYLLSFRTRLSSGPWICVTVGTFAYISSSPWCFVFL
jgi:trehalose-6-phosphate synthase